MSIEIKIPELGEDVETGTVVNVLVAVGDTIEEDQPILELETDKAVLEVPASAGGVVESIRVKDGDEIGPGHVVMTLKGSGEATPASEPAKTESTPEPAAPEPQSDVETAEPASEPEAAAPAQTGEATVVEFKLPEVAENVESGTVVGVFVSVGDTVAVDQPLLEMETDKAVLEIPSDVSGVVEEILVKEGDQAGPGQTVMKIRTTTTSPAAASAETAASPAAPGPATSPTEPAQPEPATEPEPAAPEVSAPPSTAGNGLAYFGQKLHDTAPASPSVRRFAREIGIDIHYVPGTGTGGRISTEDVKAFSRQLQESMAKQATAPAPTSTTGASGLAYRPLPDFSKWGQVERKPMAGIRRATARNLSYVWATVPHVTQHEKADVTELEQLRKHFANKVEAAGAKFTPTAIIIKVLASALKVFPDVNVSVDMETEEVVYKNFYHISVAVDTPNGLLVPVIRDVDQKNLIEISLELADIAERARARKLSLDEMQGGCITVTNLGGFGGTSFTPIINPPESAVLGVSRSRMEPVWNGSEFEPRLMMPLSLTYDHRVVDGALGIRFIRWLCEALEKPFLLMLEG